MLFNEAKVMFWFLDSKRRGGERVNQPHKKRETIDWIWDKTNFGISVAATDLTFETLRNKKISRWQFKDRALAWDKYGFSSITTETIKPDKSGLIFVELIVLIKFS